MRARPQRAARVAVALALLAVVIGMTAAACLSPDEPGAPGRARTADPSDAAAIAARAAALAAGLSDVDLVGQVLMPSVGLADPPEQAAALVAEYHLGGVILMGDVQNTSAGGSATQVRALTDALRAARVDVGAASGQQVDLLIGTDQEYGRVTRIKSGLVQLPSAMTFGAAARPELTEAAWRGAGQELAAVGINLDFAPAADVIGPAGNTVIGSRSYGSDPAVVAPQVGAAVRGLQSTGVAAAVKHFPGHGNTTVDSHDALPVLNQSRDALSATDLPPFRAGIDAGVSMVMSGHLDVQSVDPGVPASFSHKVLVDLLRGELGFTGVVVTDALNMKPALRWAPGEAAVLAMLAGNDLLLMPPDLAQARQGLLDALSIGRLPRERLVEAVTRILIVKANVAGFPRPGMSIVDSSAHREASAAVASAAVTVLRGPCAGPLVAGPVRVTATGGRETQAQWLADALARRGVSLVSAGGHQVHLVGYGDGFRDLVMGAAVTVSMDTPYVLTNAASPVRVATYSSTQVAMEALAGVIAGETQATGRSPVAVSGLPSSACSG